MRISDWSSDVCSSDLKDPELRKAQSPVALAMAVAAERFPSDYAKRREFVAERKEEVAARIGRGATIAGLEVKARPDQRVREMAPAPILKKSRNRLTAPTHLTLFAPPFLGADRPPPPGARLPS